MMLAATIAALPSYTIAADDQLAGTYRLISSTRTILETGEVLDTWGNNPNGFIIYGKDGRMLVLIVTRDRPKPESVDKITDQQRADLHRSMTAYGGTYKFDGKRVEHKIVITFPESVRYWQPLWSPVLLTPGPSDQDATSRPGSGSFRSSTRAGARKARQHQQTG